LNGIESEGWPWLGDWEIRDWSGGLNRHRYWAAFGRKPVFNYINHKYTMAGEKPGQRVRPDVPFATHRLVLVVAQCVDAAVTYCYNPPAQPGERIGLWDELCRGREPPVSGMRVRGGREETIRVESGACVRYMRSRKLDGEAHEAFLCHPPYKGGVGYTFWERAVRVPQRGVLSFHTGMSEKATGRSDGVTYRVVMKSEGNAKTLFDCHVTEWRWRKHSVSLAPWAGKRVTLRFVTDCGPRDNSTTDHAHWGDVRVAAEGAPEPSALPRSFMTFAGTEWFRSTFYFRDVQARGVELDIEAEGAGELRIRDLTVHAHPEALAREFDHGLVLANPSPEPFTFDLSALAPGRTFRRLWARERQDAETNNGAKVGKTVTLGARDGLFLVERAAATQ